MNGRNTKTIGRTVAALAVAGALMLPAANAAADEHGSRGGSWIGNVPEGEEHLLGQTKSGLDVLIERDFDVLQDKRVGLVTNHTAFTRDNVHIIDVLWDAPEVELVALFAPEHGIRGDEDSPVGDTVDDETGLYIHSLYGQTRRPTPEMFEELDVVVFDMQDIGTRFYTYISTMAYCMEEAANQGIEIVVLDRPNPIGGLKVEGAVSTAEDLFGGFTSVRPIATRHGMTVGELALMFNEEWDGIGVDLTVVEGENYRRWMYFDQTGLHWEHPSPNMKTMNGAILYPGPGTGETTMLSTGRGLDRPFEKYGAPYMDGRAVAENLANRDTPGVRFVATTFEPTAPYHRYRYEECGGVFAIVYDREKLNSVLAGLHMFQAMYETHPEEYTATGGFRTSMGNGEVWGMLTEEGKSPEEILEFLQPELDEFKAIRENYLIYD